MPGRSFASPSFGEMRKRREIATPSSSSRKRRMEGRAWHSPSPRLPRNRRHSDDLCVLQRRLRFSRASEGRKCLCRRGAKSFGRGIALPCRHAPASIPGVRADMQPRPQPTQPGASGEPQQLAKPLVLTAALAPPPEPRRFDVDQNLAANPPENASAEVVSGPVTEIRDAMTWVIGGRIVHCGASARLPGLRRRPWSGSPTG